MVHAAEIFLLLKENLLRLEDRCLLGNILCMTGLLRLEVGIDQVNDHKTDVVDYLGLPCKVF